MSREKGLTDRQFVVNIVFLGEFGFVSLRDGWRPAGPFAAGESRVVGGANPWAIRMWWGGVGAMEGNWPALALDVQTVLW
ncbi:hypothetical protein [Streptomyces sp. NPDC059129]|uniref:hypothetical protein n=1 Tax=unclassified Streptomyces TaxID=2593676 RepID=UPI00368F2A4E